jgi:hypothetical protein
LACKKGKLCYTPASGRLGWSDPEVVVGLTLVVLSVVSFESSVLIRLG